VNPGGTPAPSSTLSPIGQPTTAAQHVWAINFITTDPNGVPIDSMGLGGATDTTFSYRVDTTQSVDNSITKAIGTGNVGNISAILQGFEVINAP
jgi:hypothetical protein